MKLNWQYNDEIMSSFNVNQYVSSLLWSRPSSPSRYCSNLWTHSVVSTGTHSTCMEWGILMLYNYSGSSYKIMKASLVLKLRWMHQSYYYTTWSLQSTIIIAGNFCGCNFLLFGSRALRKNVFVIVIIIVQCQETTHPKNFVCEIHVNCSAPKTRNFAPHEISRYTV